MLFFPEEIYFFLTPCPVPSHRSDPPRHRAPRRRQLLPQRPPGGRPRGPKGPCGPRGPASVEGRSVDGTETGPATRQLDGRTPEIETMISSGSD